MPLKIQAAAQPLKHSKNTAWRKVAGEAVILDVDTAVYHSLDETGLRVWELLGEGRTEPEIAETLAGEYDAPRELIERDLRQLLAELRKKRLITQ